MEIIFSNPEILGVNKPAGMDSIPGGWEPHSYSLLELLEKEYGRLWIVHRLDKGTSGIIVFARNPKAHRELSMSFEHHSVSKMYHAIVIGTPTWDNCVANYPLRANVGRNHRTVVDLSLGKLSETTFEVIERFSRNSLLAATPATGRTHQVRVHASTLGFPLLGDMQYKADPTNFISRPALHAFSLEFTLFEEPYHIEAPYPEDFTNAIRILRQQ
jgi:tRNA pseudouridine32 synthase/23S rRNA pseudouridine746 synthase